MFQPGRWSNLYSLERLLASEKVVQGQSFRSFRPDVVRERGTWVLSLLLVLAVILIVSFLVWIGPRWNLLSFGWQFLRSLESFAPDHRILTCLRSIENHSQGAAAASWAELTMLPATIFGEMRLP